MTFSQSATPRRSGCLAPNASVAHVSPTFAGRDTTLSSFAQAIHRKGFSHTGTTATIHLSFSVDCGTHKFVQIN
jgi:hypothetical protein